MRVRAVAAESSAVIRPATGSRDDSRNQATIFPSERPDRDAMPVSIRYEQAVYGSFPFWHRGYDLLAHSPGCRPEWLAAFRTACSRYGEPIRADDDPTGAMFALRLPDRGPWLIVGVCPQGADDHGRPGALAFHGLFVEPGAYRRAGGDPFPFAAALRCDWTDETSSLPTGLLPIAPPVAITGEDDPEAARIAAALVKGKRVVLETARPVPELARRVWRQLPPRCRNRLSVATFAFANANRFDLVALPRPAALDLDRSYVRAESLAHPPAGRRDRNRWESWSPPRRAALAAGLGAVVLVGFAGLLWLAFGDRDGEATVGRVETGRGGRTVDRDGMRESDPDDHVPGTSRDRSAPSRAVFRAMPPLSPDERSIVVDGVIDLADRFGVVGERDRLSDRPPPAADASEVGPGLDPTPWMERLAARLRYRGPWLDDDQLRRIEAEPDGARILEWHEHLKHFQDDRPLPPDFADGPTAWQLAVLAWSFRVEPHPSLAPVEIPFAIGDSLAAPWPVRPSPLADRYPPVDDYARFLAGLPRR